MLVKMVRGERHRFTITGRELWKSLYDSFKPLYIWIPMFEQGTFIPFFT